MGDEIWMIVCVTYSSPWQRHYCDNMQAVLVPRKLLNRGCWWGGGWGSQENKRNGRWKNYREDIFAAVYLRKPSGWKKTIPYHQQVNKKAAVYLCLKDKYPDWGRMEGRRGAGVRLPHIYLRPSPLQQVTYYESLSPIFANQLAGFQRTILGSHTTSAWPFGCGLINEFIQNLAVKRLLWAPSVQLVRFARWSASA